MVNLTNTFARRRLAPALGEFLSEEQGLAAVELALILPVAMFMLGLATAGGQGFEIQRRVALTASTITGLVAGTPFVPNIIVGTTPINQSALDTDLALAAETMYPLSTASLTAVVSELAINPLNNTGVVVWSEPYNGGVALAVGAILQLNPTLVQSGATFMIYGTFQYTYQPVSFMPAIGPITMTASQILIPRNASQITVNWGQ